MSSNALRPTAELATQRNDSVADLAQRVFIAHAAPGSKTEAFAHKLAATGKPLLTLDSPASANLVETGAEVVEAVEVPGNQHTTESLKLINSRYFYRISPKIVS